MLGLKLSSLNLSTSLSPSEQLNDLPEYLREMKKIVFAFYVILLNACSTSIKYSNAYEVLIEDGTNPTASSTHYVLKSHISEKNKSVVSSFEVSNLIVKDSVYMDSNWQLIYAESNHGKKKTIYSNQGDTLSISGNLNQKIYLPEKPIFISVLDVFIEKSKPIENQTVGFFNPTSKSITYYDIYPMGNDTLDWRNERVSCQKVMARTDLTVIDYWIDNQGIIVQKIITYKNEVSKYVRIKN